MYDLHVDMVHNASCSNNIFWKKINFFLIFAHKRKMQLNEKLIISTKEFILLNRVL